MNKQRPSTILDKFLSLAEGQPDDQLFTFVNAKGNVTESLTRGELAEHVAKLGGYLKNKLNIQVGDRVLLAYPQESLDFVKAVAACLYTGIIPVPVAPPNPLQLESSLPIFRAIAEDCGAVAILTNKLYIRLRQVAQLKQFMRNGDRWSNLKWHRTDVRLSKSASSASYPHQPDADDIAVLQYTSGSTAAPKGVMLSHGNLAHQLDYIRRKVSFSLTSTMVSWVPHFHDFGLIAGILNAISGNGHLILFSPIAFVRDPALWGTVLSRYKATHTAAPDFAYLLATKKTTDEQRASWDLSHLQIAMSAAEPIRESTVNAFVKAYEICQFDPAAFMPAYGLAEHTVGATMGQNKTLTLSRAVLEKGRVTYSKEVESEDALTLYGCGQLDNEVSVAIVDPEQAARLHDDHVGEIWLSSPSCGLGYWGKPEATAETFQAKINGEPEGKQWLRTGDLGFVHDNELYISGRIKDVIITNGRNIYPQDIEALVPQLDENIKPGRVAAFGTPAISHDVLSNRESQGETIVVLFELRDKNTSASILEPLILGIRQGLAERLNVYCQTIVVLSKQTVQKTSSGKLKRQEMKAQFLQDALAKQTLAIQHFQVHIAATSSDIESQLAEEAQVGDSAETAIWIRYKLASHLQVAPEQIANDVPLSSYAIDSLTTLGLINELSNWLGRPLPVNLAYQHLTLRQMADMLVETQASFYELFEPGEPIELPLSPQQHWLLAQRDRNLNQVTFADLIELPGSFDQETMQRAIDHLVENREMLRTRFSHDYGEWQQTIYPTAKIELEQVRLAEDQFDLEAQIGQLRGSLNIENGPLARIVHFDFGDEQPGRLLLLVHQFLADTKSLSLLKNQLMQQYEHLHARNGNSMPTTGSATYATWLMRMLNYANSERMKKHAAYWQQVPSHSAVSVQNGGADGESNGRTFAQHRLQFDVEMTNQLLQSGQPDKGLTLEALLLNAVARACHQALDEEKLSIGMRHDARYVFNDLELCQTIGWLEAIYPFCSQLDLAHPSQETAVQVAEQLHELSKHGFSYGVLKHLCDDPDLNGSVANLAEPEIRFTHAGNSSSRSSGEWEAAINFSSSLVAGALHIQIDYCQNSCSQTKIKELADLLQSEILASPSHLLAIV